MKTYEDYRTCLLEAYPAAREKYLKEAFESGWLSAAELDRLSKLCQETA